MRVLLVSAVGERWGAEQVLLALARQLPAMGVDPVLALMRPGPLADDGRAEGVPVHAFRPHRFRELHRVAGGIRWLRDVIRSECIDLVHSNLTAHLYGAPAARLAGRPELWHVHGYPYETSLFEETLLRIPTDFALFTTQRVASGFPRLGRRPHAVVYPVCIDPSALRAMPVREDVREVLGLRAGPLLLTVARLQEYKGHRFLIHAVPKVLERFPDATFAVVGKAADDSGEVYLAELRALCTELGVAESVRFLGHVSDEHLVSLYRQAAALVHPAIREDFGLAILEAMALGAPVIAAAVDGPRELIRTGENGLLVPPGDSRPLAEVVIEILESAGLAESLSKGGWQFAETLSAIAMAEQTAAIYADVLAERVESSRVA